MFCYTYSTRDAKLKGRRPEEQTIPFCRRTFPNARRGELYEKAVTSVSPFPPFGNQIQSESLKVFSPGGLAQASPRESA